MPAVLASCAVPGLLPPVEIGGEHGFHGGLVDSIPVGRAVALGASTVYVLQVGRIDRPLAVPRRPWQVGLVAFEIARRHLFTRRCRRCPMTCACTCCLRAEISGRQIFPSCVTGTRLRSG